MKNNIIKTKTVVLSCMLFITVQTVKAQYDALFTQYMFNETFINPAYAGSKEAMSATLLHRQQWVNFPGRPITTSFSLHGPLEGNKMGVGLSILNEKVGVMNRTLLYANYAYRIKFDDKSTLAMGLMGGLDNQNNRLNTLKVSNEANAVADPQFGNSPNVVAPNFGLGLYYNTKTLYVGLSIPRLVDNKVKFGPDGSSTVKTTKVKASLFTYYLTAGYLHKINEEFKLRGNIMMKAVVNAPLQFDIGANLLVKDFIWAGLNFRTGSALSLILGCQVNKQFLVCYSYDYGVNKIQKYSQGSHEIVLNYLFSFTGRQITTPRYF
ncbi:PorP/SprF family type IX secretion system membrane protein [Aurantibacillus circumpalustris]|uniref:PorP/SprF family type IX secretion system membrane protein n=1 Tax=Aurantibacillus circumpalustris TaxID=3036359 RepID=UPI00295ACE1D|nr:type IX secretion system membrane protein PorP/SprF [Aurantibacillus circumpalustris]